MFRLDLYSETCSYLEKEQLYPEETSIQELCIWILWTQILMGFFICKSTLWLDLFCFFFSFVLEILWYTRDKSPQTPKFIIAHLGTHVFKNNLKKKKDIYTYKLLHPSLEQHK